MTVVLGKLGLYFIYLYWIYTAKQLGTQKLKKVPMGAHVCGSSALLLCFKLQVLDVKDGRSTRLIQR